MKRLLPALAVLLLATAPAHAQLNLGGIVDAVKGVAKSQEVGKMSEADEIAIGRDITAATLASQPLVKDDKLQRYLNQVGMWIAAQSERPHLPWRFAAVQNEQINAYAVPGGTVLITQGMLQMLGNEAELACVIGHEIGHITRKHHLALLQKEILIQTGTQALANNVRGSDVKADARRFLLGEGATIFNRSLDRDSEREADQDGVLLAARAGYDPDACLMFMQRMAAMKADTGSLATLYKTHPKPTDRSIDIERAIGRLDGMGADAGQRPKLAYRNP